jgi:hypothetical protein
MNSVSSMSRIHSPHWLAAQFRRDLAADLVPLLILERPCSLQRVESDPDDLARPRHPNAVRPVVHRNPAPAVHSTWHSMHPHQIPDLPEIPTGLFLVQVVGPSRVFQVRISLQPRSATHAGITLTLHPVHDFQPSLQLDARSAGPGLAPLLAHPLHSFDHPVVLGRARRIGHHPDVQSGQPADEVGGQVAPRSPGRAVVDAQLLGPAPPLERESQGLLGFSWIDLGPAPEGGKRRSARRPRLLRRRSEASRLRTSPRLGCAPKRRSVRSDAAAWLERRTTTNRAAGRWVPGRGRRRGTIGGSSVSWARRLEVVPQRASRGSIPHPKSAAGDARRRSPGGPHRNRHDRVSRVRDSWEEDRPPPAREPVSGDDARCEARGRRIEPARRRIRPEPLAPRFSAAREWGQAWASRRPPDKSREDQGCLPISTHDSSCGKTLVSD